MILLYKIGTVTSVPDFGTWFLSTFAIMYNVFLGSIVNVSSLAGSRPVSHINIILLLLWINTQTNLKLGLSH